jgi:arylsulfatase A-like enzyme
MFDPRHENSGKKLRCRALTGNIDFAPTILSLAGVEIPSNVDGQDLMQLYGDPTGTIHDALTLINVWGPDRAQSLAVVTPEWKYVNWPYDQGEFVRAEELYDLKHDRLELKNLAASQSAGSELKMMRKLYDQAVEHWQDNSVPYHNYQKFGEWFSRK